MMPRQEVPKAVKKVENGSELVHVYFEDGHKMEFCPYRHGWGYQVEGLEFVRLYGADVKVFEYHSRLHRCGPQEDEHKIALINPDYTQQQVSEYWQSAQGFIHNAFWGEGDKTDDAYWYAWRVTSEGGFDLERLQQGKAESK